VKKILISLLVVLLALGLSPISAQELTGQQIIDDLEFDNVLSASGTAELNLITENPRGEQRKFSVRVHRKSDDGGEKQFLEYLAPADVRGTKFLSLAEKGQEEQMWLYMPAIGRERRIAAHMTGDSFMGTDFTYEEIGGGLSYDKDYSVKRLADETYEEVLCYVLELTAAGEDALYAKIKMWVRQDEMIPLRVELWDPADTLKKTLTLADFRSVDGELIPHNVVMADNQKGTRTILEITEMDQSAVADEVFTVRYLRR